MNKLKYLLISLLGSCKFVVSTTLKLLEILKKIFKSTFLICSWKFKHLSIQFCPLSPVFIYKLAENLNESYCIIPACLFRNRSTELN